MNKRGPDFQDLQYGVDFAIGHTRLSIIDLSDRANQPFWDATGRYVISYNGEIYNFREIQQDLIQAGCSLRTRSDTEVLIEAILVFGLEETLRRLRGMFAFVLYDTVTGHVTAVRDPFGQKPLYYLDSSDHLGIASDVKSLLELTDTVSPYIPAYSVYLSAGEQGTRGTFHTDRTFFDGISMLPAGHIYEVKNGESSVREYFNVWSLYEADTVERYAGLSTADALDDLRAHMKQAVDRHLVSDVSVGVLLSGGIDSSLVYRYAHATNDSVSVFTKLSPGIEEIPLNVIPGLLKQCPANAYFSVQRPAAYLSGLKNFIQASSAPSRWGSGPPMSQLCADARRNGVTVLLGGDCADEYFSGYGHYESEFANPPTDLGAPSTLTALNGDSPFYVKKHAEEYEARERDVRRRILDHLRYLKDPQEKYVQATLLHDTATFLQLCNLPHSDAYSMQESVELRNPLLDLDLVQYVINLPQEHKTRTHSSGHFGKCLLRDLAGEDIGDFVNQKKEGTRNYAMTMADPDFWRFENFAIGEIVEIPNSLSKRELIRLINLEIFHRLFFLGDDDFYSNIMTVVGQSTLLAGSEYDVTQERG